MESREPDRSTERSAEARADLLARLRRVEGQLRGIARMVEEDAYCDDIIHQVASARAALDGVGRQVLENHLRGCLARRIRSGDDAALDELLSTIKVMRT